MDFQHFLPVEVQANACPDGDHSRCSTKKSKQTENRTRCLFPFRPCTGLALCELLQCLFHAVLLVALACFHACWASLSSGLPEL